MGRAYGHTMVLLIFQKAVATRDVLTTLDFGIADSLHALLEEHFDRAATAEKSGRLHDAKRECVFTHDDVLELLTRITGS